MFIKHDFHLHTNLSLCAKPEATLDFYLQKAKEFAFDKIAITNHLWDHAVSGYEGRGGDFYEVQDFAHIKALRPLIDEHNARGGTKILFGAEAEYSFENRRPAITPEIAEQLDVLLIPNSHTHLTMPRSYYEPHEKHIEYMTDAFMDIVHSDVARYVTAIPHPFLAVCCPYDNKLLLGEISDDIFKRCFTAAAEKGIALELNPNYLRPRAFEGYTRNDTLASAYLDPTIRMLRIGKECGCKFTVGSDAHSNSDYEYFSRIYLLCAALELKESDLHPLAR